MTKLLIVEDEDAILAAMRRGFEYEGYTVVSAADGQAALGAARREAPDLIILDVMLPKLDGIEVCEQLRREQRAMPIIMLTARDEEISKVVSLRAGADDYVTKPFSFLELLARVEAVLRRARRARRVPGAGLEFDPRRMEVRLDGRAVGVSRLEFRVLEYLVAHAGEVVTRDQLLDAVWGYNVFALTRTVDVHVGRLRKKLEENPDRPRLIVTVHGVGYRFAG
jgi:two-component system alkaline phosphatase synthesis response regulator PhoP